MLIGLASALLLSRSVTEPLHEALLIADTVAAGDLSQDFETSRGGEFGQLLSSMGDMEDTLTDLVTRIKESTASISVASRQNASGNAELSQRTESQSSSLLDTASNIEKLTSTVRQNSQREQAANDQALDASNFAQRGGSAGRDVVETMQAIRASSKKIVPLRSAEAAKEIKALIGHSVEQVESGSRRVDQAGRTMQEIVQAVQQVTDVLAEMTQASVQQNASIEDINQAMVKLEAVTQQNAVLVEETSAAALSMAGQVDQLKASVDTFKV